MAHQGKFVSVNLNKSYGKPSSHPQSYVSSARSRPGTLSATAGGGGSGGGGMVVLSRPRSSSSSSSQKSSAQKLSVPPPLNLPSLRKEHEKFDLSSASGSSVRPGSSGIGSGSGSSSMGWTKPAPALLQEKEAPPGPSRSGSSSYMPPAARAPPLSPGPAVDKAVFLRGEDFPSLKATIASSASKVKENEREKPELRSPLQMRPQMRPSRLTTGLATDVDGPEKSEKKEEKYFPGPLPVVKLTHTSDWADDERDTGLSLPERGRYRGPDVDASSRELYKDDRDAAGSWRAMPQPRDERAGMKPFGVGREVNRDSGSSSGE